LGEDVHAATIGVDFKTHVLQTMGNPVAKLTIWDTAGQERFRTLTSSYYRGAHGVILVYDASNRETFDAVKSVWLPELKNYANVDEMVLMIVANKIDLATQRAVTPEEGKACARDLNAIYMECSAKTEVGVHAAFEELVHVIATSPRLAHRRNPSSMPMNLTATTGQSEGSSLCCSIL
jgi:Ras-related protein Rab-18